MKTVKKFRYNKIIEIFLIVLISIINLQCIALDMWANSLQKEVNIYPDIVEVKQQITGKIGFCGFFDYPVSGATPLLYSFGSGIMNNKNIDELQNIFIKSLDKKFDVVCRYDKIKDFNYFKTFHNQYIKSRYGSALAYVHIYEEKDQNNVCKMNYKYIDFFNKYFKCDYYLAARCDLIFMKAADNKSLNIEPNFLLILYDNKGYRVWSKLLKRQYVYVDKDQTTSELYFFYMKKLITDNNLEINNTLSSIGIN